MASDYPEFENITIHVYDSSALEIDRPMTSIIVRISIVDFSGEILLKTNEKDPCFTAHEHTSYIPQICTKPIQLGSITDLTGNWDEEFVLNEPVKTLLQDKVMVFFEIIDLSIRKNGHCFTPIAWAFLKPFGDGNTIHLSKICQLQLHSYPAHFDFQLQSQRLPIAQIFARQNKLPAGWLNVEIKGSDKPSEDHVSARSYCYWYKEVGCNYKTLLGVVEQQEGEEGGVIRKPKKEIRPANRHCIIPTKLLARISVGEYGAHALNFNFNGDTLACAVHVKNQYHEKHQSNDKMENEYHIQLFRIPQCTKFSSIPAHLGLIYELNFSHDDRLLLSASSDTTVKIWAYEDVKKVKQILPHPAHVYSAKFHPQNDNLVFTADYTGMIRIWDRPAKNVVKELSFHKCRVNSIAFSPDGRQLFSGDVNGEIAAWETDLPSGLPPAGILEKIKMIRSVRDSEISNVVITHLDMVKSNNELLVYTKDNVVRIYETKALYPLQRFRGALCSTYQMRATISPDGRYIIAGSEDSTIRLWSRKSELIKVENWENKFTNPVTAIAWNRVENIVCFSSFGTNEQILLFHDDTTSQNN